MALPVEEIAEVEKLAAWSCAETLSQTEFLRDKLRPRGDIISARKLRHEICLLSLCHEAAQEVR